MSNNDPDFDHLMKLLLVGDSGAWRREDGVRTLSERVDREARWVAESDYVGGGVASLCARYRWVSPARTPVFRRASHHLTPTEFATPLATYAADPHPIHPPRAYSVAYASATGVRAGFAVEEALIEESLDGITDPT
jgi:hypothetical protein